MMNFWIPLLPFAFFFAWLFMRPRKACPDCGKLLPLFQSPFTKTKRQWLVGGYICQNCGCEADIDGNKVPAGVAPQRLWITISIVLPILFVGLALMLWIVRL